MCDLLFLHKILSFQIKLEIPTFSCSSSWGGVTLNVKVKECKKKLLMHTRRIVNWFNYMMMLLKHKDYI